MTKEFKGLKKITTDRFKFRVWDEKRKLYVLPGDLSIDFDGQLWENCTQLDNSDEHLIIEQCTGLKDKNGKLIFEGDILRFSTQFDVCVNFRNGGFVYSLYEDERLAYYLTEIISKSTQIIGNIHEVEND